MTQWHLTVCLQKVIVKNIMFPSGLQFVNMFYASPKSLESFSPTQAKRNNATTPCAAEK